jgi:hypothetical protein
VVNNSRRREADETFFVNLSGAVNALLVNDQGPGTIADDDKSPILPDALEEAGRAARAALDHWHHLGPHVRNRHLRDSVLGQS